MKSVKENYVNTSLSSNESEPTISYLNRIQRKRTILSCRYVGKIKDDPRKATNSSEIILHVSCMNCGNHVAFGQIDRHASKCTKITPEVAKSENNSNNNALPSINYKLRKLKEHLTDIISEIIHVPKEYEKEMKFISAKLSQSITESLHSEDINLNCIKSLKKNIKDLNDLLLNKEFTLSSQIYIDRARVLIEEKVKQFRDLFRRKKHKSHRILNSSEENNPQNNSRMQQLRPNNAIKIRKAASLSNSGPYEYNSEIQMKSNNDVTQKHDQRDGDDKEEGDYDNCNHRNHKSNKSDTFHHDLFSAEITKPNCIMSTNTSMSLGSKLSNEEHYTSYKSLEQDKDTVSIDVDTINSEEEKLKKDFYKAVFKIKFKKLHSSHKGQHISHTLLWNECKKVKIPQNKWKAFIFEELNNPTKYSYLKMKTKKKFFSQNFTSMAIIDEENM